MSDLARRAGISVDAARLAETLGVAVVEISAGHGEGLDLLRDAILRGVERSSSALAPLADRFDPAIAEAIEGIERMLATSVELDRPDSPVDSLSGASDRWTAIRMIEGDAQWREAARRSLSNGDAIVSRAEEAAAEIHEAFGQPADVVLAESRRRFVDAACRDASTAGPGFAYPTGSTPC